MMNILNGGSHADNNVDIQEFMIMPTGAAIVFRGIAYGCGNLPQPEGSVLRERDYSTAVGDEGGFAPDLESNEEALLVIMEGIERANYTPGCGCDVGVGSRFKRIL